MSAANDPGQADPDRDILRTQIDRRLAWAMTGSFLAVIFSVPVVQVAIEFAQGRSVQAVELFTRVPTRENLHRYEKDLERASAARGAVRPYLQLGLSQYPRFGNSNVILGRDGWLFYRPGVEFLTGRGLLDEARLRLRRKELSGAGEAAPSPDPRPAILAFHEACRDAGVHLVVVPVPDKSVLQPGELTGRLGRAEQSEAPVNPDYARLLADLRGAGVDVYDPTPARLAPGESPRFLRQDTHWTPDWMESVAHDLAAHIRGRVPLTPERTYQVHETPVRRVGDLVDMLELPSGQRLFPPQEVVVRRVLDGRTGGPWKSNPDADIVLLGDSFSNIYTASEMGWGEAAGLPAQLSRFLGREVDAIALNGSGASGTRRELAHRPAPLTGKRVVVWQFAARDLVVGNWEVVPLPPSPAGGKPVAPPESDTPITIEGTVVATSRVPAPYSVPYKDCLTYTKLRVDRVAEGRYADDQIIAVLWGLKDNVLQPAAGYAPGKRLRLRLVPLRYAPPELQSVRRVDDLDDFEHRPYLALEEQEQ